MLRDRELGVAVRESRLSTPLRCPPRFRLDILLYARPEIIVSPPATHPASERLRVLGVQIAPEPARRAAAQKAVAAIAAIEAPLPDVVPPKRPRRRAAIARSANGVAAGLALSAPVPGPRVVPPSPSAHDQPTILRLIVDLTHFVGRICHDAGNKLWCIRTHLRDRSAHHIRAPGLVVPVEAIPSHDERCVAIGER